MGIGDPFKRVLTKRDRRRYPRVVVALDITVEAAGSSWQGKTVDLSPYGVKVASPVTSPTLLRGSRVQLQLTLPDSVPPLLLTANLVRTDSDGIALSFVNVSAQHFARLKEFVDSTRQSLSNGPTRETRMFQGGTL